MNSVLQELAVCILTAQNAYKYTHHPFWIDYFYKIKEVRLLVEPYYFLKYTCLTYPYDIMKVHGFKKIVRYDYCVIMHEYNYIKEIAVEPDDWKDDVLLNRSYEAFLHVSTLPEIKTLIYSFL